MNEFYEKRLNNLAEHLKAISTEDYSFNRIISLKFDAITEQGELWKAVIAISGYETQRIQFCENAFHLVEYGFNGEVLNVRYVRGGSDEWYQ